MRAHQDGDTTSPQRRHHLSFVSLRPKLHRPAGVALSHLEYPKHSIPNSSLANPAPPSWNEIHQKVMRTCPLVPHRLFTLAHGPHRRRAEGEELRRPRRGTSRPLSSHLRDASRCSLFPGLGADLGGAATTLRVLDVKYVLGEDGGPSDGGAGPYRPSFRKPPPQFPQR